MPPTGSKQAPAGREVTSSPQVPAETGLIKSEIISVADPDRALEPDPAVLNIGVIIMLLYFIYNYAFFNA